MSRCQIVGRDQSTDIACKQTEKLKSISYFQYTAIKEGNDSTATKTKRKKHNVDKNKYHDFDNPDRGGRKANNSGSDISDGSDIEEGNDNNSKWTYRLSG